MRHRLRDANEVAHFWANQTQDSGRAGNVFFEGPRIFSYGHHFEMARIIRKPRSFKDAAPDNMDRHAQGIILFTTRSYSMTTAQHMGRTRRAIDTSAYQVFDVPNLDAGKPRENWQDAREAAKMNRQRHAENVAHFIRETLTTKQKALRARDMSEHHARQAEAAASDGRAYIRAFGLRVRPRQLFGELWTQAERETLDRRRAACAERAAARAARAAEKEKYQRERAAVCVEYWRRRETPPDGERAPLHLIPPALRLSEDGADVETSHGARVGVAVARRFWAALVAGTAKPGDAVGAFELRELDGENVRVGCHVFPFTELAAFATSQGWEGAPAAA